MNRFWHIAVTRVLLILVGGGAYYLKSVTVPKEQTGTITVTTTTTITQRNIVEAVAKAEVTKNDFLFQAYVEKAMVQTSEPITVWFNLNYYKESNITVEMPTAPFRINVWNKTHSIITNTTQLLPAQIVELKYGRGITGNAVIDDGLIKY